MIRLTTKKPNQKGLGEEDWLHIKINYMLRQYERAKKLNCVFWTYLPFGEQRTSATGGLLKKKGVKRGVADFLLINPMGQYFWIEIKVGKNGQTPEQKEFQEIMNNIPNSYYQVCKSLEEIIKYLEEYSLIITE